MESNYITEHAKLLKIGDFPLNISRKHFPKNLAIPYAGMAFYYPESLSGDSSCETLSPASEPNFEIRLDSTVNDAASPRLSDRGDLLYGSENFYPPTFVYRQQDGFLHWIEKNPDNSLSLAFRISPDWTLFQLYAYDCKDNGENSFRRFGDLYSYAILNFDACVLHGVVMEYCGKGILVTAASGTGKTTHTRMWREYKQALILNGDRCLCRKKGDIWYAYGMPWSGSSGEYINRRVPISAIVVLERGAVNKAETITGMAAFTALMQRIFAPQWDAGLYQKAMDCCESLTLAIPMYRLQCRPDRESVEVLEKAIFGRDFKQNLMV